MFCNHIQNRFRALGREEGPDKEHGLDFIQAPIQSLRNRQIAADDVDAARQARGIGVAGQRTDTSARAQQLATTWRPTLPVAPVINILSLPVFIGVSLCYPYLYCRARW